MAISLYVSATTRQRPAARSRWRRRRSSSAVGAGSARRMASRSSRSWPACWAPHSDQVGQTGTKIAPDLYIACGISGATQHMAGCKGAKRILAINADAEAPIMQNADYTVVGDLKEIVPAISVEIRKIK